MRRTRLLAHILALATMAYLAFAWLRLDLNAALLLALGIAVTALALGSARRPRRDWNRWVLPLASAAYAFFVLVALALHVRMGLPVSERIALPAFLILGLALSLRSTFQAARPTRPGYHNYFDSPRLSDQRPRPDRETRPQKKR